MFFLLPIIISVTTPSETFVPPKPLVHCEMNEVPYEWICIVPNGGTVTAA